MHSLGAQVTYSKSLDINNSADVGVGLARTDEGYIILAGSICDYDCTSIIGTDYFGNILWKKQIENLNGNIKLADNYSNHGLVINEATNNIYISGITREGIDNYDCFIYNLTLTADSIWFHKYGGQFDDINSTLIQATDTSLILFSDYGINSSEDEIWILYTDLNGNVIHDYRYGSDYAIVGGQDILQLHSHDIIYTYIGCNNDCGFDESKTLIIAKINNLGEELWSKPIFEFTDIWGNSTIIPLNNGGFVVSFYEYNDEGNWIYPPILIWLDSLGNVNSIYYFQSETESIINDLALTSSGMVVGAGSIDKLEYGYAGWVFSFNPNGELLWNKEIVDSRYPAMYSGFNAVLESENGGLVLTGMIIDTFSEQNPNQANQNIWLVKLDDEGCLDIGCKDLQILTRIEEVPGTNQYMKIFPTVTDGDLHYHISNLTESIVELYVSIISADGKIIEKIKIAAEYSGKLDLSFLTNGIYFLKLSDKSGNLIDINKVLKI